MGNSLPLVSAADRDCLSLKRSSSSVGPWRSGSVNFMAILKCAGTRSQDASPLSSGFSKENEVREPPFPWGDRDGTPKGTRCPPNSSSQDTTKNMEDESKSQPCSYCPSIGFYTFLPDRGRRGLGHRWSAEPTLRDGPQPLSPLRSGSVGIGHPPQKRVASSGPMAVTDGHRQQGDRKVVQAKECGGRGVGRQGSDKFPPTIDDRARKSYLESLLGW